MKQTPKKLKTLQDAQDAIVRPLFAYSVLILFAILFLSVMRISLFSPENPEQHIIFELVFLILLAIVAEIIVFHLKQPTVLILMLLGVVMGSSFLSITWAALPQGIPFLPETPPQIFLNMQIVGLFAQLGAIILMFKAGLHSSISKIFTKDNFFVAFLGIVFPFLGGYYFATLSGGSFQYALFLGAALTATSVGVTVAILKELKLIEQKFAQVIIGAAVIDDILALLVLALVLNMPSAIDSAALEPFLSVLAYSVIFIIGGAIAGKYFVQMKIDKAELNNKTFLYALAFVFLYAYIAQFIGLSGIVGAFLAGMLLAQSRHASEIDSRSLSIELIFTPIFFISLGMLVDVPALAQFFWPIVILSALAILAKFIGCGAGALLAKLSRHESALVGVGMAPRGEVALIIALFGLSAGVLDSAQYSIICAMAFLTTVAMPPVLYHLLNNNQTAKGGTPA